MFLQGPAAGVAFLNVSNTLRATVTFHGVHGLGPNFGFLLLCLGLSWKEKMAVAPGIWVENVFLSAGRGKQSMESEGFSGERKKVPTEETLGQSGPSCLRARAFGKNPFVHGIPCQLTSPSVSHRLWAFSRPGPVDTAGRVSRACRHLQEPLAHSGHAGLKAGTTEGS